MSEPWLVRLLAAFAVAIAAVAVIAATRDRTVTALPPKPLSLGPVECSRFAAVGGDDDASGAIGSPYATVQRLVDALREGETGCLRGGTYEGIEIDPDERPGYRETKITSPGITLSSAPGERARLDNRLWIAASDVTVANLDLAGTNPLRYAPSSITISGDRGTPPIESVRLVGNDITNANQRICVNLGVAGYGRPLRTVIEANRIHDCGVYEYPPTAIDPPPGREFTGHWNEDHGIYVGLATDTLIRRNLIYDNASRGVQLYPDSQNTRVSANVIDNNGVGVLIGGTEDLLSAGNIVGGNVITASSERFNVEHSFPGCDPDAADGCPPDNVIRSNCLAAESAAIDPMPAVEPTQDDLQAFYETNGGLLDAGRGGPYDASVQEGDDGTNLVLGNGSDPYVDRAAKDFRLVDDVACGDVVGGDHGAGLGRWSAAERVADPAIGVPAAAVGAEGVEAVAAVGAPGEEIEVSVRRPTRPSMQFPEPATWEQSTVPASAGAQEIAIAVTVDRLEVVWTDSSSMFSSTLSASDGEWSDPAVVSVRNATQPAVAVGPDGARALAWVEGDQVIVEVEGAKRSAIGTGESPALAFSDPGTYAVGWVNGDEVKTASVGTDGTLGSREGREIKRAEAVSGLDLAVSADGAVALAGSTTLREAQPRAVAMMERERIHALSDAGVAAEPPGIAIGPNGRVLLAWSGPGSCAGCDPEALQAARYLP